MYAVSDVAAAFVVVFLAELGDKTQLVALTLGGRYPAGRVLLVLAGAIALLQTISVTVGALVSRALPDRAVAIGAGLLFLGFAVWTWRSADETSDDPATARAGLLWVATAFFLAELGDKTMLTTAGLAADRGAVPVWIGSFAAMLSATALAVLAGRTLTQRVDPSLLRRLGAAAFADRRDRHARDGLTAWPMMGSMPHWLLLYDLVDDYLERRAPLRPEHLALAEAAHARGELVMAGALAEPADRAVLVFRSDDAGAAEAFAQADPYVRDGLVRRGRSAPGRWSSAADSPTRRASAAARVV